MRKMYDDFIQQKPKEMAKTMSDMTNKYINPETNQPTQVPASHYEKELGYEIERSIAQETNRQVLTIMYNQLNALKKDNPKHFYQTLICMDNNLNPKDLRIPEQVAMNHTYDFLEQQQRVEKKNFRFLNQDISEEYRKAISDPNLQARYVEASNFLENEESRELNRIKDEDLKSFNKQDMQNNDDYSKDLDEDYEMDY